MNVTREVITDLLPVYFSGEASADTRALVEDYFRQDPDFERIARRAATPLDTLKAAAWPGLLPRSAEAEKEKRDLESVRGELRRNKFFFGGALFFSLAPFAFEFEHGHIVWMMVRDAPWEAVLYWIVAAFLWAFYFARLKRRTFALIVAIFFTLLPALDISYSLLSRNQFPGANRDFDLIPRAVLLWSVAAAAWFAYFARLRLRTRVLVFAIFLTLLPLPFLLYPVLAGGPKFLSGTASPVFIWCAAGFLWIRYFFLRSKPESEERC